jgi:hypothetical protein
MSGLYYCMCLMICVISIHLYLNFKSIKKCAAGHFYACAYMFVFYSCNCMIEFKYFYNLSNRFILSGTSMIPVVGLYDRETDLYGLCHRNLVFVS